MGIRYPYSESVIPICFATCSIEPKSATTTLPEKLKAIHRAGFDAVELAMSDLLAYGKALNGQEPDANDYDAIVQVAKRVKSVVEQVGIAILMLRPFTRFEGWKFGCQNDERDDAFARARGWLRVMEALGTHMLQVGSSDAKDISHSADVMAADLAKLAEMCAEKGFRVAFENSCWATRAATWKAAWEIVDKADQPNLGLTLDTFQIAGAEFGDPTTRSGLIEDISRPELQGRWMASLRELSSTVPSDKIFVLQLSDAYKMNPPMDDRQDSQEQQPRSKWSQDFRPLPFDGGYLPIHNVLRAVLDTGFRGWMAVEVHDSLEEVEGNEMETFAKTAKELVERLLLFS